VVLDIFAGVFVYYWSDILPVLLFCISFCFVDVWVGFIFLLVSVVVLFVRFIYTVLLWVISVALVLLFEIFVSLFELR